MPGTIIDPRLATRIAKDLSSAFFNWGVEATHYAFTLGLPAYLSFEQTHAKPSWFQRAISFVGNIPSFIGGAFIAETITHIPAVQNYTQNAINAAKPGIIAFATPLVRDWISTPMINFLQEKGYSPYIINPEAWSLSNFADPVIKALSIQPTCSLDNIFKTPENFEVCAKQAGEMASDLLESMLVQGTALSELPGKCINSVLETTSETISPEITAALAITAGTTALILYHCCCAQSQKQRQEIIIHNYPAANLRG